MGLIAHAGPARIVYLLIVWSFESNRRNVTEDIG